MPKIRQGLVVPGSVVLVVKLPALVAAVIIVVVGLVVLDEFVLVAVGVGVLLVVFVPWFVVLEFVLHSAFVEFQEASTLGNFLAALAVFEV